MLVIINNNHQSLKNICDIINNNYHKKTRTSTVFSIDIIEIKQTIDYY